MSFSEGGRHQLSYVDETAYGTTPGTPTMAKLRHTTCSLKMDRSTLESQEVRNDHQTKDLRHGNNAPGGDVGVEFSYGAFDEILASLLFSDWATNVLKVGNTQKSFSLERGFADINQFDVYTGCLVDALSLSIAPEQLITGVFSFLCKDKAINATSLGSPTDAFQHEPFDSFTGAVTVGGGSIDATSLELSIQNNLARRFAVGEKSTLDPKRGRLSVTGTLGLFFKTKDEVETFLNEGVSSLSVTLEGSTGGDITIDVPRLKYTGEGVDTSAADADHILTLPFQGLFDETEATTIMFTRIPQV